MKTNKHPEYRYVVFKDSSSDLMVLTGSTIKSEETIKWEDGNTYPLIHVEISSKSHPFYTGKQKIVDTENRVKNFEKRAGRAQKEVRSKRLKNESRRAKVQQTKSDKTLTLRDMLKNL